MPELPEVEVIRTQIESYLPLTVMSESRSSLVSSLTRKSPQNPHAQVTGTFLVAIRRHGKVLLFDFKSQLDDSQIAYTVTSQLGMSGGWRISNHPLNESHVHLQWKMKSLKDQKTVFLSYQDPRRFGSLGFLTFQEAHLKIQSLGVDVSSEHFNLDYLQSIFKKHPEKAIKPFLLDQKYFAGIGNYMANEICARAGIRPTRKIKKIKKEELQKIFEASKKVLDLSQKSGGLTFLGGYKDIYGSKGQGLAHLVVFHQKICQICKKTPVKKSNLGNRATFYCPSCQK
jgi:formamidopyrimidine-DNA glycosylase